MTGHKENLGSDLMLLGTTYTQASVKLRYVLYTPLKPCVASH